MLQAILNQARANMTDKQFTELMKLVTTDIRINRIAWGKWTGMDYVLMVLDQTYRMLKRVA